MNNSTRILLRLSVLVITCSLTAAAFSAQSGSLTPAQNAVEKQRQRLSATDPEERRDALMQLWAMHRAEASRVAVAGLTDASPMVRAVAAKAILALGPEESVAALTPLLGDKDEFVRREVAYALGKTKSRNATSALAQLLLNDKEDGVRSAAAVSLGEVGDETAVVTLANVLSGEVNGSTRKKSKGERNPFVLRAVARSLGQIKSRAAVPALITALTNEKFDDDIRREAARSLGMIGDPAAVPALRAAASSADPYLAQAAFESLRKLNP